MSMRIFNVDKLLVGTKVDNYEQTLGKVLPDISNLKEEARYRDKFLTLGGIKMKVLSHGRQGGYSYGLECNDFTIFFTKKDHGYNCPIMVEFSQYYLWKYVDDAAWRTDLSP